MIHQNLKNPRKEEISPNLATLHCYCDFIRTEVDNFTFSSLGKLLSRSGTNIVPMNVRIQGGKLFAVTEDSVIVRSQIDIVLTKN